MDATTAFQNHLLAKRIVARVKSATHQVPMGSWDEVDHFWPNIPDFDLFVERADRFGDAYEVMYQSLGGEVSLFVTFFANDYVNSEGAKPMKYEATFHGAKKDGTVRKVEDISKLLSDLLRKAKDQVEKIREKLEGVGGTKWDVGFDGYELVAQFHSPNPEREAYMVVTFEEVDEVIFGSDKKQGSARIYFAAGADYEGSFGEKTVTQSYRSIDDIEKVLKKAEGFWTQWSKQVT